MTQFDIGKQAIFFKPAGGGDLYQFSPGHLSAKFHFHRTIQEKHYYQLC